MTARQKKICRSFALVIAAVALVIGGYAVYLIAQNNLHAVPSGQLFRSGQMSAETLTRVIREHGIKTVINLRGDNPGKDWYDTETNTTQKLGVQHFDFSLSASREVSDQEMDKIVATLERAPKPLLVHCKNGADRSGLVGALYLYTQEHQSAVAADKQLTVWCGHIPYLFWRDTVAMDRSFWRYTSNHVHQP